MKAKDVIGRKIVKIVHQRWWNGHLKRMEADVDHIELDDGSVLYPACYEAEDQPAATIYHIPNKNRRKY